MLKCQQIDKLLVQKGLPRLARKLSRAPAKWKLGYPIVLLTPIVISAVVGAAATATTVLHGRISVTEHAPRQASALAPHRSANSESPRTSNLADTYGKAAESPGVAAAIRRVHVKPMQSYAKAVSDAAEALEHGNWKPGASPIMALMYGYVPPNMPPEEAAMLAQHLPKLSRMPQRLSIEQMAGEPTIPLPAVAESVPIMPTGSRHNSIAAANQDLLEETVRNRFGPVYVPPLHVGHALAAARSKFTSSSEHQGSIREMTDSNGNVESEFTYDPWGVPTQIAGSGQTPDKLFHGMYYHQRSGNYLTLNRVYNPTLGRWLTRDPLGEDAGTNLYAYAANDPINKVDPLGLDVYILDKPFSSVGPLGHIGEMVGTPETGYQSFTFVSTGHSPVSFPGHVLTGKYSTLDEALAALYPQGYRRALDLHTNPAQDAAAIAAAQSWDTRPYLLLGSSCSNHAKSTAKATGLPIPRGPFNFLPRNEFKTISRAALNGKLGVSATMINIPAPEQP